MEYVFYLTNNCNLKCKYCYEGDKSNNKISIDIIKEILSMEIKPIKEEKENTYSNKKSVAKRITLFSAISTAEKEPVEIQLVAVCATMTPTKEISQESVAIIVILGIIEFILVITGIYALVNIMKNKFNKKQTNMKKYWIILWASIIIARNSCIWYI